MAGKLVSFIIPTRNSEKTVEKCIKSVVSQKCRKEIIVVDGKSNDRTPEILRKLKVTMHKDNGGKISTARNLGLKLAKGDYIAFVDSDVVLPGGWTEKALKLLEKDDKIAGVGGPGISREKSIVSDALNALLYGKSSRDEKFVDSLATMDVIYRRKTIGSQLFEESLETGEDPEFNFRLIKRGWKLLFSEKLRVWHDHPISFGGIMKKWYNYGNNYPVMCSKHKEMKGGEYYARISYIPLMLIFIALSIVNINFIIVPVLQLLIMYIVYLGKGIEIGAGNVLAFSFVHTIKQLAQLTGTMAGLRKII